MALTNYSNKEIMNEYLKTKEEQEEIINHFTELTKEMNKRGIELN